MIELCQMNNEILDIDFILPIRFERKLNAEKADLCANW